MLVPAWTFFLSCIGLRSATTVGGRTPATWSAICITGRRSAISSLALVPCSAGSPPSLRSAHHRRGLPSGEGPFRWDNASAQPCHRLPDGGRRGGRAIRRRQAGDVQLLEPYPGSL